MKRYLLLLASFLIMLSAFSAPWDISRCGNKSYVKPFELPGVLAVAGSYVPASETGTGYANLWLRIFLDGYTGEYWAKARVKIYCQYWGVTGPGSGGPFPTYPMGWIWGYKEWEVEVSPNSWYGTVEWTLSGGETFNTYVMGDGSIAILDSDVTLVSWEQE